MTGDETNKQYMHKHDYRNGKCDGCDGTAINHDPVASNTGKELKPCPFCGSSNVRENGNQYQVWCLNDSCGNFFIDYKVWQNAWAHKLIEALQRQNKTNEEFQDSLLDKIASLESYIKDLESKSKSSIHLMNQNAFLDGEISDLKKALKTAEDKLAEVTKEKEHFLDQINSKPQMERP